MSMFIFKGQKALFSKTLGPLNRDVDVHLLDIFEMLTFSDFDLCFKDTL